MRLSKTLFKASGLPATASVVIVLGVLAGNCARGGSFQ